jgi:hypothetical protein
MNGEKSVVALETPYKGCRFRSRLEARWAVFYDAINAPWSYENDPVSVDGVNYLPDFRVTINGQSTIHEVKPEFEKKRIRGQFVYLAGKMGARFDWRGRIMPMAERLGYSVQKGSTGMIGVTLEKTEIIFTGPFPAGSIDEGMHGSYSGHHVDSFSKKHLGAVTTASKSGIERSEIVCAHINSLDCFGTLVEIGIAKALGKHLSVTINEDLCRDRCNKDGDHNYTVGTHDLWFPLEMADHSAIVENNAAARVFHADVIKSMSAKEYQTIAGIAATGQRACLTFGDPAECVVRDWWQVGLKALCSSHPREAAHARGYRFT